jgi:hypothetical protein
MHGLPLLPASVMSVCFVLSAHNIQYRVSEKSETNGNFNFSYFYLQVKVKG